MTDHTDIIIIGAGVVGLAIAKALSETGKEVLVLEKEKSFGMGTSSRNSEVIHAGLYFDKSWLKTKFCIRGKELLYNYALSRDIPHKRCGKLMVACSDAEIPKLEEIKDIAWNNGVRDIVPLSKRTCLDLEPDINAVEGVFSPSSGVIDTHTLMFSLLTDLENNNGQAVFNTEIKAIDKTENGFAITIQDDYQINTNQIINAAGLGAQKIAHSIDVLDKKIIPDLIMAKGHYFSYSGKTNFKHLIYPLPFQGGLGIHLTLDMAGGVIFGPDVLYVKDEEYSIDSSNKTNFIQSIKYYFPKLDPEKLNPDYAGIRPKLSKDGLDFDIQFEKDHGVEGLVNLFGIESPGLTSSLAIAEYIKEQMNDT